MGKIKKQGPPENLYDRAVYALYPAASFQQVKKSAAPNVALTIASSSLTELA